MISIAKQEHQISIRSIVDEIRRTRSPHYPPSHHLSTFSFAHLIHDANGRPSSALRIAVLGYVDHFSSHLALNGEGAKYAC